MCSQAVTVRGVCTSPGGAEPSLPAKRLGALQRSRIAAFWARDVSRFSLFVCWEPGQHQPQEEAEEQP